MKKSRILLRESDFFCNFAADLDLLLFNNYKIIKDERASESVYYQRL